MSARHRLRFVRECSVISALSALAWGFGPGQAAAQATKSTSALESYRRQDWTGQGSFHRLGLFREQSDALQQFDQNGETVTAEGTGFLKSLSEHLSLEAHENSMFFGSSNILNSEFNPIRAGQFAQFVGAAVDFNLDDWTLVTGFDQAWFRFYDGSLKSGDFNTSTVRQALSYQKVLLNNKVGINISPGWQYSSMLNTASHRALLDQWSYGLNNQFSWFARAGLAATFSYDFSYLNVTNIPGQVADKFKNDFNLGVTITPFTDVNFFVSPSVQYSYESNVGIDRKDSAWTPTIALTYQPFSFFAVDAVGSYTHSSSTFPGSSFVAYSGTAFARLFYRW